jgi:hypothetical protein
MTQPVAYADQAMFLLLTEARAGIPSASAMVQICWSVDRLPAGSDEV